MRTLGSREPVLAAPSHHPDDGSHVGTLGVSEAFAGQLSWGHGGAVGLSPAATLLLLLIVPFPHGQSNSLGVSQVLRNLEIL